MQWKNARSIHRPFEAPVRVPRLDTPDVRQPGQDDLGDVHSETVRLLHPPRAAQLNPWSTEIQAAMLYS